MVVPFSFSREDVCFYSDSTCVSVLSISLCLGGWKKVAESVRAVEGRQDSVEVELGVSTSVSSQAQTEGLSCHGNQLEVLYYRLANTFICSRHDALCDSSLKL
jgi:hypothetical protein